MFIKKWRWVRRLFFNSQQKNVPENQSNELNNSIDTKYLESKHLYQAFFEKNTDAVMLFDVNGNFIHYNTTCSKLTGFSSDELQGSFDRLILPHEKAYVWEYFNKVLQGEDVFLNCHAIRKDGKLIKLNIRSFPIQNGNKISGVFSIARDISNREVPEELYKNIVENVLIGLWIIQDGIITFVNRTLKEMLKDNDMVDMAVSQYIFKDDQTNLFCYHNQKINGKTRTDQISYRLISQDQKLIDVQAFSTVITYCGKPAIMESILDVTDKTSMEHEVTKKEIELELSERRYTTLNQNANHVIVILDPEGCVKYISPSFESILGYPLSFLLEKDVGRIFPHEELQRIRQQLKEILESPDQVVKMDVQYVHRNSMLRDAELIFMNKVNDQSIKGIVVNFTDITDHVKARQQIMELVSKDALTRMANRKHFEEKLDGVWERAKITQQPFCIMFLDLDRFKYINDTLGYHVGDLILKEVSRRLMDVTTNKELLARLGGDEFVILAEAFNLDQAQELASRILALFNHPFIIDEYNLYVTASIGISVYPQSAAHPTLLMSYADLALFQAKAKGKNQVQVYKPEMNKMIMRTFKLSNDLIHAIASDKLSLHYQPLVDPITQKITGVESLVRWSHPTWGPIHPSEFIPIAEDLGLISEIGYWVLEQACLVNQQWQNKGLMPIHIAVNISTIQMMEPDLIKRIVDILVTTGMNPRWLVIEITENTLLKQNEGALKAIKHLREMGIKFAIDDFGTGYSSLSYLKNFSLDILKIDKSFVADIATSKESYHIVSAISNLAKQLGMKVVAEGVETVEQLNKIKATPVDFVQGYLYSEPVAKERLESLLEEIKIDHGKTVS